MKFLPQLLVVATTLWTSLSNAQELASAEFHNMTYGGTGCPQGSLIAYKTIGNNRTVILFPPLQAFIGPLFPIVESRDNCHILLDISYAKGWQYAVQSTSYTGTTALMKGITGVLQATYYFSGSTAQQTASSAFVGPQNNEWSATEWISTENRLWSDCKQPLPINIVSQVRMTSSDGKASGTIATDGRYDVQLVWRKC